MHSLLSKQRACVQRWGLLLAEGGRGGDQPLTLSFHLVSSTLLGGFEISPWTCYSYAERQFPDATKGRTAKLEWFKPARMLTHRSNNTYFVRVKSSLLLNKGGGRSIKAPLIDLIYPSAPFILPRTAKPLCQLRDGTEGPLHSQISTPEKRYCPDSGVI